MHMTAALLSAVHENTQPHTHTLIYFRSHSFHAVASNPCGPNGTCHNNGSCVSMYTGNGTSTYSCLCRPSFTGEDCSQLLPSESLIDNDDN